MFFLSLPNMVLVIASQITETGKTGNGQKFPYLLIKLMKTNSSVSLLTIFTVCLLLYFILFFYIAFDKLRIAFVFNVFLLLFFKGIRMSNGELYKCVRAPDSWFRNPSLLFQKAEINSNLQVQQ